MAYDDRFYDELHRSGDTYQKYRDQVAEEQAAHAREMGQLYGQLPQKTLQAGMQGADWAQNRGLRNQQFQAQQAEMGRAEENQGFRRSAEGRDTERFAHEKGGYANDDMRRQMELDNMKAQNAFDNTPATEEQASKYHLQPGATRRDLGFEQGYQGRELGFDTARQQLANARQQAQATAQQIAQNAQTFQNGQYSFESQKAASELDDIYGIKDPKVQTAALQDWHQRHGSKLLGGEQLANMAQGAATRKQAQMGEAEAQRAAATKLIYGSAVQEAQALTQKLQATQKLSQTAKIYDQNAYAGGLYENDNAKDAREQAAATLASLGNHNAAEKVQSGMLAGARGILSEQAKKQSAATLSEFNDWYARQDNRVQDLPEVKRAYQQAQQLQSEMNVGPDGPAALRKLPSLVGGMNTGANVQANRAFLGGDMTGGMQQGPQQPAPTQAGFALGNIPLPGRAAPAGLPAQQPQAAPQGQAPGIDPYGFQKSARPKAMPAGVQGGYYGPR